ncbi:MAG: GDSL-type esterase/lipase family protein [Casimicrobiaceae bacterium]
MRRAALVLSTVAGATVLLLAGCATYRLDQSRRLAAASEPFSVAPASADRRLLIVGDSTGVGTGASSPRMSVAGQLATLQPRLAINNLSADGARFADVLQQLETAAGRYDIVLVMAGGNDVIRLTPADELRMSVVAVAERASSVAPTVIFLPAGNVGNAPFFFPPWSWWMSARARELHALVLAAAARTGATYVNLYKPAAEDPFAQQPKLLHAADGLHPSDAGYSLWVDTLLAQSPLGTGARAAGRL